MLNTSWAKKIPISVIKRIIVYNHHFTIGTHAVIVHSTVLCRHHTFWHDTTAHNKACDCMFPECGGLRKTAMSSCVPFIKRFSPLWQSLTQTDSLGFDKELKQVYTRRGSSTAAICLGEQRQVKYSVHLLMTYCTKCTGRGIRLDLIISFRAIIYSSWLDCHQALIKPT